MFKSLVLFSLALFLSLSIVGPSFLALFEGDLDIELVQDIEEEKKETKKELEEYQKFLNDLPLFSIEIVRNNNFSKHYYLVSPYGHIKDVHSPPPDYL